MRSSDKKSGSKTKPVATTAQLESDNLLNSLLAPYTPSNRLSLASEDDDIVSSYQPPVAPSRSSKSKSKSNDSKTIGVELSRSKDKRIDMSAPDAKSSTPAPQQMSAPKSSSSTSMAFSSLSSSAYHDVKADNSNAKTSLLSADSEKESKGHKSAFNPIVPYERPKPPSSSSFFCNCLPSINLFGKRATRPAPNVHPAERLADFMSHPASTEEGSYVPPTGDHIPGFTRKN